MAEILASAETVCFDVAAVRARFSALARPTAFLDGPGGTQVPDEVIEAIAGYLREDNANIDGPFATSVRTNAVVASARVAAARFFSCLPEEVGFGLNMTSLDFHLSRTATREFEAGDEIAVTKLDHDANIAPWLDLAADRGFVVRFVDIHDDTTLDYDQLKRLVGARTRIVAFPWASNGVGTTTDVKRIVEVAHSVGALAWLDATHYAVHGPIDVKELGADVVFCSPYKFFGPHLGLFYGDAKLLASWRPYKVRPAAMEPLGHRFETGTLPHEDLAGFVAAVDYIDSIGWDAIKAHERALGERFLAGLPEPYVLHGVPTMDGRVATFAINLPGTPAQEVAARLAERDIAVWAGHYYAVEVMQRLGLDNGAVRIGFVHYNTPAEVDRVLAALGEIAAERHRHSPVDARASTSFEADASSIGKRKEKNMSTIQEQEGKKGGFIRGVQPMEVADSSGCCGDSSASSGCCGDPSVERESSGSAGGSSCCGEPTVASASETKQSGCCR